MTWAEETTWSSLKQSQTPHLLTMFLESASSDTPVRYFFSEIFFNH